MKLKQITDEHGWLLGLIYDFGLDSLTRFGISYPDFSALAKDYYRVLGLGVSQEYLDALELAHSSHGKVRFTDSKRGVKYVI